MTTTKIIDPLSTHSLLVEPSCQGKQLGTATGFTIRRGSADFLVTNSHVVAGLNPETGALFDPTGRVPDELRVWLHSRELGGWNRVAYPLRDATASPRWLAHADPTYDVALLRLDPLAENVTTYPLDLELASADVVAEPAMPVSIIGFPLGLRAAGLFPIWKTGHIASDPDLDCEDKPTFLIDATTRGGMSGSPVVIKMAGGHRSREGGWVISGGSIVRFLGVYSGRLHRDAEIGRVWRPNVIDEILGRSACS